MTRSRRASTARKIWELLTHAERRGALGLLGLTIIGMLLETLGVGLVIPALALLTQSDIAQTFPSLGPVLRRLGNPSQGLLVVAGMLFLLGVYLIKSIFLAFLVWRQTRFALGVQVQLSRRLFTSYLHQPYTFHLQRNSAQLLRNITGEINLFTFNGMLPGILLLTEGLVSVGLIVLLLLIEPLGAVIAVAVTGAVAWTFHRFSRSHLSRWGAARQHHEGMRIQHLQQGLGGVKDVKLLAREAEFIEEYQVHNVQSARALELQLTLLQLPRLWLELLAVSGLVIVVMSMLAQDRALEAVLPTLGLFAAVAFRLMPSANRVLGAIQTLRYTAPVIDVLHAELALTAPETTHTRGSHHIAPTVLELDRVTYAYPEAVRPAVEDISLSMRLGESIGFIGTSGAGKSTLVDLLLGLLTPDSGSVSVDGTPIQENLRGWQDQIGYVPQAIFLTDDTLRRNVAFGIPGDRIDDAAVLRAIAAAQLDGLVATLPDGLETVVGERGIRLSGGQRQRIGIARALYHDPNILVLDEATSSLDTATENEVMQSVRALRKGRMIIIVAHRLSTVDQCDRLYRLEEGRIVEQGRPSAMVAG